jgi:sulfide:quinone oxidoreductase
LEHFSICPLHCWYRRAVYCVKRGVAIDNFSWSAILRLIRRRIEPAMDRIAYLTPAFAVTGALDRGDLAKAAALGFKAIVSNLPDGESVSHPDSATEARLAAEAGLAFRHIPATKHNVFDDRIVDATVRALGELEGPVLAHCASGLRSALAWAAAAARSQPADCVLAALRDAGFDLAAIRDDLEEQHGHAQTDRLPPALDCRCRERSSRSA